MAALAAQAGLKGNVNIMEQGFLKTFGDTSAIDSFHLESNRHWSIEKTYIKIHFGCRHTHSSVDGCLNVMKKNNLQWHDIQQIIITTYPMALDFCNRTGAKTASDAIYDIRTIVALAVVYGDAAMHRFDEKKIVSHPVQNIVEKINLNIDPQLETDFPNQWPAIVKIKTITGQEFSHRQNLPRGEPEDPLSTTEIENKFHQLSASVLNDNSRQRLLDFICTLPEQDSLENLFSLLAQN